MIHHNISFIRDGIAEHGFVCEEILEVVADNGDLLYIVKSSVIEEFGYASSFKPNDLITVSKEEEYPEIVGRQFKVDGVEYDKDLRRWFYTVLIDGELWQFPEDELSPFIPI